MKKLHLIIFLILSCICNAQISNTIRTVEFDSLDWSNVQLDISDSTLLDLIKESKILNNLYEAYGDRIKSYCHPVDLGFDSNIDILFYWPTSVHEQLVVYKNDGESLFSIYKQFININHIESDILSSSLLINGVGPFQCFESCPGNYYELFVGFEGRVVENKYLFYKELNYKDSKIPVELQFRKHFTVANDKYRLRARPEINDDNIICELAPGDFGVALSSELDAIGRIWWFVVVENNIKKSEEYFHVDGENYAQRKTMGWISSRYVIEK